MMIQTVLLPAEIARWRNFGGFEGATCVVFDVLRATTTIIEALSAGVREVVPVVSIEEARALKADDSGILLAGERRGDPIDGFDFGNSPLEFSAGRAGDKLIDKRLVITTTNGTAALVACARANNVLVCSLTNVSAVADWLLAERPARAVFVCAGTGHEFALEDGYGAGVLAGMLVGWKSCATLLPPSSSSTFADPDDATRAAMTIAERFGGEAGGDLRALQCSRNGKALALAGRERDISFCAERDRTRVVAFLNDGTVRAGRE